MKDLIGFAEAIGVILGMIAIVWLFQKAIEWFENH
jgi:hypothetical protein